MASRIPALPRDSHLPSHAAVHKNKLCDSHAPLVARAIAGGWTRPHAGAALGLIGIFLPGMLVLIGTNTGLIGLR